jgi:hypothetical protein
LTGFRIKDSEVGIQEQEQEQEPGVQGRQEVAQDELVGKLVFGSQPETKE